MNAIDLVPLITYAVINTFTPGPNNIISASSGLRVGLKRTLPCLLGISCGFCVMMILAGFFADGLLRLVPQLGQIVRWLGTAYIVWLAIGVLRSDYSKGDEEDKPMVGFWGAVALQYVNPKALVYATTIYTIFLAPVVQDRLAVVVSALLFAGLTFAAVFTWAAFGSIFKRHLQNRTTARFVNSVLALLLLYVAIDIAGLI